MVGLLVDKWKSGHCCCQPAVEKYTSGGQSLMWGTVSLLSLISFVILIHKWGTVSYIYAPHQQQQNQHHHPKTLIMERYSCGTETLTVDTLVRMTP